MRSAVLIVALLTIVAGAAVPATATSPSVASLDDGETQTALDTPTAAQQSTLERSPQTDILIELHGDQSADWRIEMRYELETENETAGFEAFAQEYEAGTANVGLDADLFERVSETAEEQTGRSMAIENVTTTADVENDTGVVVLTFTWTNFLEETDEGLRLGDAFSAGTEGTWLASLGANQNLTIQTPPGHAVSSTSLPLENNAIVIEGPRTFESTDQLTVSYVSTGGTPAGIPWELLGGGLMVVAVLLVGVAVYLRRQSTSDRTSTEHRGASELPRETPTPETTPEAEGPDEERPPAEPDDDDGVDVDLLSDEERVELLLEQKGGRMKQANIVKETGWSDAKVSQLLSSMADNGRVEKLRLGRENLISLPDEDEREE